MSTTSPEDDELPWRQEKGLEIREQAKSAFEASKTEPDLKEAERLAADFAPNGPPVSREMAHPFRGKWPTPLKEA